MNFLLQISNCTDYTSQKDKYYVVEIKQRD